MGDIVERLREATKGLIAAAMVWTAKGGKWVAEGKALMTIAERTDEAARDIVTLRAEVERLRIENIQMQAALGYGILAEDERHIIPSNPFKCGTCDARAALAEAPQGRIPQEKH